MKILTVGEIIKHLEAFAPLAYQENYDNSGLLTGNPDTEVSSVLLTLDVTEEVIQEAITKGCKLIIAHHPILFSGIKSLTGNTYVERCLIKAIKNDICLYAIHTNLDNVKGGVSFKMAQKLGLNNVQVLMPSNKSLKKLVFFVPYHDTELVLEALHKAGAGNIGNYTECSFQLDGVGTFKPNDIAKPHIGESNRKEQVQERRIEAVFPVHLERAIMNTLFEVHPYEEVAYYITTLENYNQEVGGGAIGELIEEVDVLEFLKSIKDVFKAKLVRHTTSLKATVKTIALCGGAGSFMLKKAIEAKADVFISADFKYHEFFDTYNRIIIADVGHFESEQYTKELLAEIISNKFTNIAVVLSEINTNPVHYL